MSTTNNKEAPVDTPKIEKKEDTGTPKKSEPSVEKEDGVIS